VTHDSFSSTYPQTEILNNILFPLLITNALILYRSENKLGSLHSYGSRTATLPNHSKLNRGCSNATSAITAAIARADWSTMDADHDSTVRAPAPLFFKEASHTESSSCSWLGLRGECLDLSLQKVSKNKKKIAHIRSGLQSMFSSKKANTMNFVRSI
jgi:hypothetical protein